MSSPATSIIYPSSFLGNPTVPVKPAGRSTQSASTTNAAIGVAVVAATLTIVVVSVVAWRRHQRSYKERRTQSPDSEETDCTDKTTEQDGTSLSTLSPSSTRETDHPVIARTLMKRSNFSIRGMELQRSHFTMTQIIGEDIIHAGLSV